MVIYKATGFKMADGEVFEVQIAPVLQSELVEKYNICECCNLMRAELEELKSELKSCREIIRIIQEEAQVIKSTPYAAWNIVNGDRTEELQANVQDGWRQNSSNRRRRPQNIRTQLQQLPVHTSNRFEPLTNLKDDNGVLRC